MTLIDEKIGARKAAVVLLHGIETRKDLDTLDKTNARTVLYGTYPQAMRLHSLYMHGCMNALGTCYP